MELLQLFKTIGLFEGLNDDQLNRLVEISQQARYDDGDEIIRQGEEGDNFFIIRQGQVEVIVQRPNKQGSDTKIYLGLGQIFGEMALVDRGARSASVRCCRDNTVLSYIKGSDFTALCESDTEIGYIVMRNMAADLSFKLRYHNLVGT